MVILEYWNYNGPNDKQDKAQVKVNRKQFKTSGKAMEYVIKNHLREYRIVEG